MEWVDTHSHLNDGSFDARVAEVLDTAWEAGVREILVVGTDLRDSIKAVEMALAHESLHAVVGLQPNNLGEVGPNDWKEIEILACLDHVVAIGETGMDRYWKKVPIELQREYFLRHLDLSHRTGKPVVIHCRHAESDVVEALTTHAARIGNGHGGISGVMHSYTGDLETAQKCLALGLHISFAGMLTFKKNDVLRAVAKSIPLERLLVETDSPYLSPEPFRGKPNEPARVVLTGSVLAAIHQIETGEMAHRTTDNARQLFALAD